MAFPKAVLTDLASCSTFIKTPTYSRNFLTLPNFF